VTSSIKYILLAVIMLAMGGLALINQGTFMGGSHGQTVARVGDVKISRGDFDHMFHAALQQSRMSRDDAIRQGMPKKELQRQVNSQMFALYAHDLGLVVGDDVVRAQIEKMIKPYTDRGMKPKDAFRQMQYMLGYNESTIVSLMRGQIATDQLTQMLLSGARAPGQMLDDAMKYRYELRRGEYFTVTAADLPKIAATSDDALKSYYKTISAKYMEPELRSLPCSCWTARPPATSPRRRPTRN